MFAGIIVGKLLCLPVAASLASDGQDFDSSVAMAWGSRRIPEDKLQNARFAVGS
jgi:hypothetical protein